MTRVYLSRFITQHPVQYERVFSPDMQAAIEQHLNPHDNCLMALLRYQPETLVASYKIRLDTRDYLKRLHQYTLHRTIMQRHVGFYGSVFVQVPVVENIVSNVDYPDGTGYTYCEPYVLVCLASHCPERQQRLLNKMAYMWMQYQGAHSAIVSLKARLTCERHYSIAIASPVSLVRQSEYKAELLSVSLHHTHQQEVIPECTRPDWQFNTRWLGVF
jgi:hypothetical protein